MNLIIDIGNTIAKVALFDGATMVNVIYDSNQSLDCLIDICDEYPIDYGIVATVIDLNECVSERLSKRPIPVLYLGKDTLLPVANLYETRDYCKHN